MKYYANVKVKKAHSDMVVSIELHNKTNTEVDSATFEFVEHIIKKLKPVHWEILNITEHREAVEALGNESTEKEERLEKLRKAYNKE